MAEHVDDGKKRDDDGVDGPYQQQRAEALGGRLRTSSRKTGGGKLPHAPAEMSEADPLIGGEGLPPRVGTAGCGKITGSR